jgi:hypothetical protein
MLLQLDRVFRWNNPQMVLNADSRTDHLNAIAA